MGVMLEKFDLNPQEDIVIQLETEKKAQAMRSKLYAYFRALDKAAQRFRDIAIKNPKADIPAMDLDRTTHLSAISKRLMLVVEGEKLILRSRAKDPFAVLLREQLNIEGSGTYTTGSAKMDTFLLGLKDKVKNLEAGRPMVELEPHIRDGFIAHYGPEGFEDTPMERVEAPQQDEWLTVKRAIIEYGLTRESQRYIEDMELSNEELEEMGLERCPFPSTKLIPKAKYQEKSKPVVIPEGCGVEDATLFYPQQEKKEFIRGDEGDWVLTNYGARVRKDSVRGKEELRRREIELKSKGEGE
jgi:hypothetical protein